MTTPRGLIDHLGRTIDFGRTADDYDRHRPGFPASVFERLEARGWLPPKGTRLLALDLGTGTGAMALELAARGLDVVALDRARPLLDVLERRAKARGLVVRTIEGAAESTGEAAASFDLVTAAQCWWWFDAPRVLAEVRRLLVPGGRLLIPSFSYLPIAGSLAGRSEEIVLAHNPGWGSAGSVGIYPEQANHLASAGFQDVETFSYDVEVPFTHEGWRGRMRACNGVAASLGAEAVAAIDRALTELLARDFPGEVSVRHRVFVASGTL